MMLSDTQSLMLGKASRHPERLAAAPTGLPAAARNAVFRSMLKNGLLAECAAPREYAGLAWRQVADGVGIALRITDTGLRAIGGDPHEGADAAPAAVPGAAEPAPEDGPVAEAARDAAIAAAPAEITAPPAPALRGGLRQAAQAVLEAWDSDRVGRRADGADALAGPIERLRVQLVRPRAAAVAAGSRTPRGGTKQEAVLALLRRPEGASGPQLIEATGWAPHTVRGFLASLARKGVEVRVLERVRRVGPNKVGAKGSYTVYRIAGAA